MKIVKLKYSFFVPLLVCLLSFTGCQSGKLPCPKINGKMKSFKSPEEQAKAGGVTTGHQVKYDNNGILKKKKYKNLRNRPQKPNY